MKKSLLPLLAILLIFIGCDTSSVTGGDDPVVDPTFSLESADSGATTLLSASSRAISAPNGLKISFRSSDIEFWATGGNFTNLRSLKYHEWDGEIAGANLSTEIGLSDSADNVIFMPNMVKLSDYEMPEFDKSLIYDVARMDIGDGRINFTMNGSTMTVDSSVLSENGRLDANSIVFIDRSVLDAIQYVPGSDIGAILNDYFDNSTLDGTYDYGTDTSFILDFVVENTATWKDGSLTGKDDCYTDISGALFVPFDPVDFTGKSNANKVKIKLEWDLDTVFTAENSGTYTLNDTAGGTPYSFDVSIEIK